MKIALHYPGHLTERPSARKQLAAILDDPDPQARVRALKPLELHGLLAEVGLSEASELALLASPEQIQRFFDLDAWRGSNFHHDGLTSWLELYLQLEEEPFVELYEGLDPELLPIYLKHHIQVWLADEDGNVPKEVPEDINVAASPDHEYYIAYPEDERIALQCRAIIDKIYSTLGVMKGWAMLESTRWEIASEMEETALHFRSARLEEMGFRTLDEALAVYAYIDPVSVRSSLRKLQPVGEDTASPLATRGDETPDTFLGAALSWLASHDLEALVPLERQLLALSNLVASADGVEPGVISALEESFKRTAATLGVGLEYLSRGRIPRAAAVLQELPLREIFRAGYSLTLKLQKQARDLVARGQITIVEDRPASLLSSETQELLEALSQRRPQRNLEDEGWFRTQSDIEKAAQSLALVAIKELFCYGILGITREQIAKVAYIEGLAVGPTGVSFDNLLAMLILREHVSGERMLVPFAREEVAGLDVDAVQAHFDDWLGREHVPPEASSSAPLVRAFIAFVAGAVLEELVNDPDPRYTMSFLMMREAEPGDAV